MISQPPIDVAARSGAPADAPRSAEHAVSRWSIDAATVIVVAATLIAVGYFFRLILDLGNVFVHVDYYRYILPESIRSGLGFGVQDLIDSLQLRAPGEFRPRFLTYLIQAYDMKIRLHLHQYMVVHPTVAPIAWAFQSAVALGALYRLVLNLTGSRMAALSGLAVYGSSTGFLSGFTMAILPGKALSNIIVIVVLLLGSEAARRLKPGQLLVEAPLWIRLALSLVLLTGLFLDELPIFAFVLVPVAFIGLFLRWPLRPTDLKPTFVNGVHFAIPAIVFLLFVIFVVPPLTERYFGFRFDYLGNTLAIGENRHRSTSFMQGPYADLAPSVFVDNFMTLSGVSLASWRIAPYITSQHGDYPGGQENTLPKLVILAAFYGLALWFAWRLPGPLSAYLRGLLVALGLFILFLGVLLIRHIPVATGYYYGSAFAAFLAVLVGLMVAGVAVRFPRLRVLSALAVLAIVLTQIDNFAPINAGWVRTHHEGLTRSEYSGKIPLKPPGRFAPAELQSLRQAWLEGNLERFIQRNRVSVEAVYLVFELRAIDEVRAR